MRVPSDDDGMSALLEPQPLSGADLQYLAPEILQNQPFDGYAVDLWAAGIMLCIMLFGAKTPFMWASPTDKTFREISLNGNLKGAVGRWLQRTAAEEAGEGGVELQYPLVSEDALDLIQGMLRAKPSDRFRLDQVKEHPWMAGRSTPPAVPTPSHHHHTPVGR
jgi:serine/threonine protein kinase